MFLFLPQHYWIINDKKLRPNFDPEESVGGDEVKTNVQGIMMDL